MPAAASLMRLEAHQRYFQNWSRFQSSPAPPCPRGESSGTGSTVPPWHAASTPRVRH